MQASSDKKEIICINKCRLSSKCFVLSAGTVTFDQKKDRICLVQNKKGEFFLPKGRKNVGESLEETAIRETYEETGFLCKLLPVTMPSRATPRSETKEHYPDIVRMFESVTEPISISIRPGSDGSQKIIFWFIAITDGSYTKGTQMENEQQFHVNFYTLEDAIAKLTFDEDKELVKNAAEIVR
ncbi:nudix hydrolase domain-containing protein [Trichonephila clavata]|uniref:Nudix hydrolase domain-containing protein n=1 Tax=Trichonephila clavata TaxID=2740835 RepID=A0A8X6L3T8_TRICU|nr:nudix hydrolase domain-containing protein [Trichonephila clavata]